MGSTVITLEKEVLLLKKESKDLWYADSSFHSSSSFVQPIAQTPKNITELSTTLSLVFVLLILSFFIYLLYKRWVPRTEEEDDEPDRVDDTDFLPKIREAEAGKNFRLALRYAYLQALKSLSQQSLIKYEKGKPNATYVYEIRHHKWGETFRELTHHYDYAWYGNYPVEAADYFRMKDKFKTLLPHV